MKSASSMPSPAPKLITPLRVALVEDQREVRQSWANLVSSFSDFTCVCTCASGEEAVHMIPPIKPDVILMDIFLPRMSGIECTARLKSVLPGVPIVILTAYEDDEMIFLALEAGADGFLLKLTEPEVLRSSLLDVLNGGAPMSSEVARRVVEYFRQKGQSRDEMVRLSVREEETLVLLTKGYSNKEIATRLNLSIDTVCSHLKHVYEKLHVHSRAEAVARYMRTRITDRLIDRPPAVR